MKTISEKFRADVERYIERAGIDPTSFGVNALNNPAFIGRLRLGMSPRIATVDKVLQFMQDNPPPRKRQT